MGPLNTSLRVSKTKRVGWQEFWRQHFCSTWREDLCHFTHPFVSRSFIFQAMGNSPTSAAELDSDPDSPHLDLHLISSDLHWACVTPRTTIGSILTIHDLEGTEACRSYSWRLTRGPCRVVFDPLDESMPWLATPG